MSALRSAKRLASSNLRPLYRPSLSPTPRFLPSVSRFSTSASQLEIKRHQSTLQPSISPSPVPPPNETPSSVASTPAAAPLANLPTKDLLRGLLLHSVSSSSFLVENGTKFLLSQAHTVERNLPLKWALMQTFYPQFCAGSSPPEIHGTVQSLRSLGISGIILSYAREIELHDKPSQTTPVAASPEQEIAEFLDGMLKTISYTDPGDFVAVKYTGSGRTSLQLMHDEKRCTENKQLGDAMHRICKEAKEKGVNVLIDAEQIVVQPAVDKWTLSLMRQYNSPEKATIYNTYQMYTKRSPALLASHVAIAEAEGWCLGVKLVRGAYLGSDPRDELWPTKERTDEVYNGALRWLISGAQNADFPDPRAGGGKKVDLMVATHNKESVEVARSIERAGATEGAGRITYGQLMGMADELSLGLVAGGGHEGQVPEVYKYAVWGSVEECVKYLTRRARENKDAVGRSKENVEAVWGELKRRWKLSGSPK